MPFHLLHCLSDLRYSAAGQCYDGTMAPLGGMKVHDGVLVIKEKFPVLRFVGMWD